jgi:hypothetical protein
MDRWQPELWLVLAGLCAAMVAAPLNTDAGFALVTARRLLGGDRLYVDIVETNPPMIYWLFELPALAGRFVVLRDDHLAGAFAAVLLALSIGLAWRMLHWPPRLSWAARSSILSVFLLAAVLPYLWQVAQREQIAAILVFPYTVLAARRIAGSRAATAMAIVAGLLAGVGFAIKPFFLAAWFAIEIAVFAVSRPWSWKRPEPWIVAGMQAAFAGAVLIGTEYLQRAVPLARAWYWAYGNDGLAVVGAPRFWMLVLTASAVVTAGRLAREKPAAAEAYIFGAAALGWLVAYASQRKGWFYHLLPAVVYTSAGLVASILALAAIARSPAPGARLGARRLAVIPAAVAVAAAAAWFIPVAARVPRTAVAALSRPYEEGLLRTAAWIEQAAAGEPVYVMSTSMFPTFPIVNLAGATFPYHYHFLWPIPALYAGPGAAPAGRSPDRQDALERAFFDTVVRDLVAIPPRVLVVNRDRDQQAMNGVPFDFVAYFSRSAQFRALMQRYQLRGTYGSLEVFERR